MTEKTQFPAAANDTKAVLPEKCCAKCSHSRELFDKLQMKTMFLCKALPPVPLLMLDKRTGQPFTQSTFPVLDASEECDLFMIRAGQGETRN